MRTLLLIACALSAGRALAQSALYTLTSPHPEVSDIFGYTLAAVGDLNGDGTPDLAIGAVDNPGMSPRDAGRVYLFSGTSGDLVHELVSPNEEMDGFFGGGVAATGDLNSDGTPDLLVGAIYEARGSRPNGGRVYSFSGATGSLLYELAVPDTPRTGNQIGSALAGLGDVTGDGISDLAVGDPGAAVPSTAGDLIGAGKVYVFSGTDGSLVRTLQSPSPVGEGDMGQQGGQFGFRVTGLGDATGDGVTDLAVFALAEDRRASCTGCQSWALYLYSGATGGLVWTARRTVVSGTDSDFGFGEPLAVLGDVDGDGVTDLAVGSETSDAVPGPPWRQGAAFVISGRTGAILRVLSSPIAGQNGFGFSVGAAGDADGDGTPDVAVLDGALSDGPPRRVRVFSGVTGTEIRTYASPTPQPGGGSFGLAMTTLGDLDGDGRSDLVISAPNENVDGVPSAGRVYVFSGMPVAGEDAPPSAPAFSASITPNPARSSVTLALRLAEPSSVRVAVVDMLGRVVRRLDAGTFAAGRHAMPVDVSGLAPGVYVVRLATGDDAATATLTVAR